MVRLAVCLAFLGAALPARADDLAVAREHFKRGIKAYDLGHFTEAVKEFEAAYTAKEEPALLFNLGQSYRFSGDYAGAIRSFRAYLRHIPNARNRPEVEARIVELQKLLDEQTRMKEKPPSETIAPPPEAHPPPTETRAPPSTPRRWPLRRPLQIAGLTLMGAGVVSLILGGTFAGLASSARDQANSASNGVFDPKAEDRMNLYQNLDIGFFVTGGVLAAGGLAAFLVGRLHPAAIEVTPTAGPGRAGVKVEVKLP